MQDRLGGDARPNKVRRIVKKILHTQKLMLVDL